MNIFVLHRDQHQAVSMLHNKHVVKMVLETAQLLCSMRTDAPYKRTHYNHPCSIWTRTSSENYDWLCTYGKAIAAEYTKRYNKRHKSEDVIDWCIDNKPDLPKLGLTEFPQCMPGQFKRPDPVEGYQLYYADKIKDWK